MTTVSRKTALVVGATSRTGQVCIQLLLEKGYEVTGTTRMTLPATIPDGLGDRLLIRKLHLENIKRFNPEEWMKDFDLAIFVPPVNLSKPLLPLAKKHKYKRLVFVSSYNSYQFGHTPGYAPIVNAEKVLLESEIPTVIAQPTMITGYRESPFAKIVFERSSQGKPFIHVIGKKAKRQPVDYRDLASALVYSGENKALQTGRYPVAGQDILTEIDLCKKFSAIFDNTPINIYVPAFITSSASFILSKLRPHSKLSGYLSRLGVDRHVVHDLLPGWSPKYSFEDSLENITSNPPHSLDFLRKDIM